MLKLVLILVLLDYWFLTSCGNPLSLPTSSLNPCFAGLLVSDIVYKSDLELHISVLILVLLDYWFLTMVGDWLLKAKLRLNPCFAGLLVSD